MSEESSKKLFRLKAGYNQHTTPTLNSKYFTPIPYSMPRREMSLKKRGIGLSEKKTVYVFGKKQPFAISEVEV